MRNFTKLIVPPLSALTVTVSLAGASLAHESTVNVSLWDKGAEAGMAEGLGMGMHGTDMSKAPMGIKLSADTVVSGRVTFHVTNNSKDSIHEMVVVPVKGDGGKLPYVSAEHEVDEDKIGDLGEVSELDPGQSGSLTLNLRPGKYALFCNVAGHYMSGMWTLLTVN